LYGAAQKLASLKQTNHGMASHIVEAQTAVEELRVLVDDDSSEGIKKNLPGCTWCWFYKSFTQILVNFGLNCDFAILWS